MASRARVSFTLDPDVIADVRYISKRLGVSSSVLVSDLLAEPVSDLRSMLEAVPPNPTEQDFRRFRGESVEIVEKRLANLRGMGDDLFGNK